MRPVSGWLLRSEDPYVANHFVFVGLVAAQMLVQYMAVGCRFLFSFSRLKVSE